MNLGLITTIILFFIVSYILIKVFYFKKEIVGEEMLIATFLGAVFVPVVTLVWMLSTGYINYVLKLNVFMMFAWDWGIVYSLFMVCFEDDLKKHREKTETTCIKSKNNSQVKKDGKVASRIAHLEPRSIQEEDKNKLKRKTKDADNQPDTSYNLNKTNEVKDDI